MSIAVAENCFHCEICGDKSYNRLLEATDYKLETTDRFFSLVECKRCGHVVLYPMPAEADLNFYYPRSFYRAESSGPDFIDRLNYHHVFRKMRELVPSGNLLDVGCGNGDFLATAAKYGYEVYGQEVSREAICLAQQKLGSRIYGRNLFECNFPSEHFDAITLWHVAEHVLDIKLYISEIRRILKPGGVIFLEVPNFNCFERKLFGKYWLHLEVPRHVRFFRGSALQQLFRDAGFSCETNKGWGLIAFPFSLWNNVMFYLRLRAKRRHSLLKKILFVPVMIINALVYLGSLVFWEGLVIGAACRKLAPAAE